MWLRCPPDGRFGADVQPVEQGLRWAGRRRSAADQAALDVSARAMVTETLSGWHVSQTLGAGACGPEKPAPAVFWDTNLDVHDSRAQIAM